MMGALHLSHVLLWRVSMTSYFPAGHTTQRALNSGWSHFLRRWHSCHSTGPFTRAIQCSPEQFYRCQAVGNSCSVLRSECWSVRGSGFWHTQKPAAAYTRTLVFGLSHCSTAQNCPYPYPPSKLGTVPSDSPFSGPVVSKLLRHQFT